jgi:hypothetical protein
MNFSKALEDEQVLRFDLSLVRRYGCSYFIVDHQTSLDTRSAVRTTPLVNETHAALIV